jgi:Galactose mutarotase and related enzymes
MNGKPSCTEEIFEILADNSKIMLYRITNGKGITAEILNYGGIIHRLLTPDKNGNIADITLGQDNIAGYQKIPNCAAPVIGRVANRISKAQFVAGGTVWHTENNAQGDCTLHSGSGNYANRIFTGKMFEKEECAGVILYLRDNGEGGFPGSMDVSVTYSLDINGNFRIFYEAMPDMETPINLTNHVYFNLSGHKSGSVEEQLLQIDADFFMTHHVNGLPLGEIRSVKDTDLDFTTLTPLKQGFHSLDPQLSLGGYDHNYCIRGRGLRRGGCAKDLASGRCLEFFTDMPGVQLYTGIHLYDGICHGKDGAEYRNECGFCLETQHYPDAVNLSQFPSPFYMPGQKFESETIFRFFTEG